MTVLHDPAALTRVQAGHDLVRLEPCTDWRDAHGCRVHRGIKWDVVSAPSSLPELKHIAFVISPPY